MSFNIYDASVNSNLQCPICISDLSEGEVVCHENDGKLHPIHRECIFKAIENAIALPCQPTCPSCRTPIVKLNDIDIDKLSPSSEMIRVRQKTVIKALRLLCRQLGIKPSSANLEKMLKNEMCISSYLVKHPMGTAIVECIPDPTKRFGNYGYRVTIQKL